jgi:hypothetical protein
MNNYNSLIFNDSNTFINSVINIIDNKSILEEMSLNAIDTAEICCSTRSIGKIILSILKKSMALI